MKIYSLLGLLFCIWLKWFRGRRTNTKNLRLPPGPRALPIIGNLMDMPTEYEWIAAAEWSKVYGELANYSGFPVGDSDIKQGDMVYVESLGTQVIFLNKFEVTNELFEKRSALYSDRPLLTMSGEL